MYKSLREAALDLEKTQQLVRINTEISPDLDMAEVHRRIYDAQGPALWFQNVKGSKFTALSNLYGTHERTRFLFRDTLESVQRVIELKADPARLLQNPLRYIGAPFTGLKALPRKQFFGSPILYGETTIDQLPQVKSWGMDGGAFVTLPQVYTEDPEKRGIMGSNLGMYRIQLSGNDYEINKEIGLHYQIHRGIGVHHTKYNDLDEPFRCSIFVGGLPSHAFSAIMPLPEGLPEVTFAGMLAGRAFRYVMHEGHVLSGDADFVITGEILKNVKKSEGPFGDHLGYYSLAHDFPVMRVHKVHHRKDAIWHFTAVGRPPAEDSSFGYLIHELVRELTPQEFPGLVDLHAVDAAGVHPLLLAVGKERYMPFRERKAEEILTIANRILGSGQTSLAKFLFIAATESDAPNLNAHNIAQFFNHLLARVDWQRDLHFQTNTTIDTLDYSGSGWNAGSKVVIACCGAVKRDLAKAPHTDLYLPKGFENPQIALPGVLMITAPKIVDMQTAAADAQLFVEAMLSQQEKLTETPLIVLCDDSAFAAATLNNFVWVTFTRANPSHDIYGVAAETVHKHWGCRSSLVIDARIKPHHAPVLVPDKKAMERVDSLFQKNGALAKWG
jgi:4-hydroxy-3-polyprenylbenzoate decarboxylase